MPTVDFERRVETTLESISQNDDIHPDNKEEIHDFIRDLRLEGLSSGWLQKLTSHLKVIAEHLEDTRFEDMDKGDVKDLIAWAQGRDVSDATVNAYKQVVKRFWRWRAEMPKGEHPDATAWINTGGRNGNDTLPKDLLTREDVDALLEATRNPRDKAFIALLWETGARIGELIDITVGDIEDHKNGQKVVIDGKTGPRRLFLVESTPHMNRWLSEHPDPKKEAPLWCQLRDGSRKLSYHYIRQKLLVRAGERAAKAHPDMAEVVEEGDGEDDKDKLEFHKPLNPHHFRHSRATYMANEFTEAQLCEWFGWVQGSDVPAKYVHLSGRDLDKAYGQLHGVIEEDEEDEKETVQRCPRCQELNEPDAAYCMRCGFALDQAEAADFDEKVETDLKESYRETDPSDEDLLDKLDLLDEMLDDPAVKRMLHSRMSDEESD